MKQCLRFGLYRRMDLSLPHFIFLVLLKYVLFPNKPPSVPINRLQIFYVSI